MLVVHAAEDWFKRNKNGRFCQWSFADSITSSNLTGFLLILPTKSFIWYYILLFKLFWCREGEFCLSLFHCFRIMAIFYLHSHFFEEMVDNGDCSFSITHSYFNLSSLLVICQLYYCWTWNLCTSSLSCYTVRKNNWWHSFMKQRECTTNSS